MLGSLLLAVFLSPLFGGAGYAEGMNMASMLGAQALGVGAVALWSAIATAVSALAVSLFLPMRVSEDDERQGLDIASHGERGWEFD
jgi:Amt family ammonium transporter